MSMKHLLLLYMQLENYVINNVATSPSLQYSKCYISEKWNLENWYLPLVLLLLLFFIWFFFLLFLKQEQQQYWPANRFHGYFRIE